MRTKVLQLLILGFLWNQCIADVIIPLSPIFQGATLNCTGLVPLDAWITYLTCVAGGINNLTCPEETILTYSPILANCYYCYNYVGCFRAGGPFITPIRVVSFPPQSPEQIGIVVQLYTRRNPNQPFNIPPTDISSLSSSNFNKNEKSIFLIGGYTQGDFKPIDVPYILALLGYGNYNVFVFNWLTASQQLPAVAIANTRMGGALLAYFIQLLHNSTVYQYPYEYVTLIGISYGAQLAGFAGERVPQIAEIQGLDPGGPNFAGTAPECRLDPTDACCVSVIHTNAGVLPAFGTTDNCGDLDFWVNGGSFQPACAPNLLSSITSLSIDNITQALTQTLTNSLICSHGMSAYYYYYSIPSVSNCTFSAKETPAAQFLTCLIPFIQSNGNVGQMGFFACKNQANSCSLPNKRFCIDTKAAPPFCKN